MAWTSYEVCGPPAAQVARPVAQGAAQVAQGAAKGVFRPPACLSRALWLMRTSSCRSRMVSTRAPSLLEPLDERSWRQIKRDTKREKRELEKAAQGAAREVARAEAEREKEAEAARRRAKEAQIRQARQEVEARNREAAEEVLQPQPETHLLHWDRACFYPPLP